MQKNKELELPYYMNWTSKKPGFFSDIAAE